jgi:hypothetical protein
MEREYDQNHKRDIPGKHRIKPKGPPLMNIFHIVQKTAHIYLPSKNHHIYLHLPENSKIYGYLYIKYKTDLYNWQ